MARPEPDVESGHPAGTGAILQRIGRISRLDTANADTFASRRYGLGLTGFVALGQAADGRAATPAAMAEARPDLAAGLPIAAATLAERGLLRWHGTGGPFGTLALTPAGRGLLECIAPAMAAREQALAEVFAVRNRTALANLLVTLERALQAEAADFARRPLELEGLAALMDGKAA